METIEIKKENISLAIKAADCGATMAEILGILFNISLKQGPPLERIFTFEAACLDQGFQPDDSRFTDGTPRQNASNMLEFVIIPSLRAGWLPDWNDTDQEKWYGWYYMNDPGFRFRFAFCDYASSRVGSWRVLPSREHEEHLAKYFLPVLKNFYC